MNSESHDDKKEFPTVSQFGSEFKDGYDPAVMLGEKLGAYKLISVIGQGGFGVVYLAQQERPVRRKAALKIIKPGMDSGQVIARFEAERQALAMLEHSNIAKVYSAGTTQGGRPYFVMEYIDGKAITDFCDENKLNLKERLELFIQVCLAVEHGHRRGIIHRDIKPSNIIVTMQDGKAVPKIIDFGVAKAINLPLTDRTIFTEQGQLLGTPEYMSPEQADMSEKDIDTRTDIYSLGVVLYELLAGTLPFDGKELRQGGYGRIQRIIREQQPPRPSTKLSRLGDKGVQVAEKRRMEISALVKSLNKELEWIPLMAIRKERGQRYKSASDMAEDIENYLAGNPLKAGPESAGYRFKKFVKKRKGLVAAVSALIAVLAVSLAVISGMYFKATAAKAQAQIAQEIAERRAYSSVIQHAWSKLKAGDHYGVAAMLGGTDPKFHRWEWGYIKRMYQQPVWSLEVLPSSSHFTVLQTIADENYILAGSSNLLKLCRADEEPKILWEKKIDWPFVAGIEPGGKYIYYVSDERLRICDISGKDYFTSGPEQIISGVMHPDGVRLYLGTEDGKLTVFDTEKLEFARTVQLSEKGVRYLAIGSEGKLLASSTGIKTRNTGDDIIIHDAETLEVKYRRDKRSGEGIRCLAMLDSQEKILVIDGDSLIDVLPYDLSKIETQLDNHKDNARDVRLSPDETKVITASRDGTAWIYDVNSWQAVGRVYNDGRVDKAGLLSDESVITLGKGILNKWDSYKVPKFDPSVACPECNDIDIAVCSMDYRMDGKYVVVGGYTDQEPFLYDVENNTTRFLNIADSPELRKNPETYKCYFMHNCNELVVHVPDKLHFYDTSKEDCPKVRTVALKERALSTAIDPAGKFAAVCYERAVELINLDSGEKRVVYKHRGKAMENSETAFSADGKRLALLKEYPKPSDLIVIDLKKNGVIHNESCSNIGFSGEVISLAYHPNGRIVALGRINGIIELHDIENRTIISSYDAHPDTPVNVMRFSPDGDRLLTGGGDRKLILWDWKLPQKLVDFENNWYVIGATFSPDGRSIACMGPDYDQPVEIRSALSFESEQKSTAQAQIEIKP